MEAGESIGGATGGIPEHIFKPGFKDTIKAGSGRFLECRIEASEIHIENPEDKMVGFHAKLLPNNLIEFNINNKELHTTGEKHPDIYPKALLEFSIHYFERLGYKIDGIQTRWVPLPGLDDNYNQYHSYLAKFQGQFITEEHKREAARQTWTGGVATALGFSDIRDKINDTRDTLPKVAVTFRKPLPPR